MANEPPLQPVQPVQPMRSFKALLADTRGPLLLPGAHDALSARMIEDAGFAAYGIGGAAVAATQLALPDIGAHSFGEYRDTVARITEGSRLPVMVDGENGFGDAKAVTRTVRSFERLGVGGLALEDLVFPPRLARPPAVISPAEINTKLAAALAARQNDGFFIIGRTDAAYTVSLDEALQRARAFEQLGVDAVLVPGLPDLAAYQRLRDAVRVPIFAVVVPGSPWFAPSAAQLAQVGIEAALYPAVLLFGITHAMGAALASIRSDKGAPPAGFELSSLGRLLKAGDWAAIDQRFGADDLAPHGR
jgi:2-methylisocitrate lyase-like PEP mutase family enzyme